VGLASVLAFGTQGCISKGDTQINNTGESAKGKQNTPSDAGAPSPTKHDSRPSSNDARDAASSPQSTADDTSAGPTSKPDEAPEPSANNSTDAAAPDTSVTPKPTGNTPSPATTTDNGSAPSGSDTSASPTDAVDAGESAQPVLNEVCSPSSGLPVVSKATLISVKDYVDKTSFSATAGPSEHFVAWADPGNKKIHFLTVGDEVSAVGQLAVEVDAPLLPTIAVVYSSEAEAYAVTWSGSGGGSNNVGFNWIKDGAWLDDAHLYGVDLVPGYVASPMGLAYDGTTYAIAPAAQHPYGILVSQLGTGNIIAPAGGHFSRRESRDIVAIGDGKFANLGHYNDGSVGQLWETLSVFDSGGGQAFDTSSGVLFDGVGASAEATNPQLVWLGSDLFGVVYGDSSNALRFSLLSGTGAVINNYSLSDGQWPLDAYFDAEQSVLYILATNGADITFMAIDPNDDAKAVLKNRAIAPGEDVTDGFLLWDEAQGRHRAYFTTKDGNLHQIYTSLVECAPAP
jgi:hypothetical protein